VIGDQVFWNVCSGRGRIVKVHGDVISVQKDDGGEVMVFRDELSSDRSQH
jgi:hypothetical protein